MAIKYKRFLESIFLLLIILLFLKSSSVVNASTSELFWEPDVEKCLVGDSFSADLILDASEEVIGIQSNLSLINLKFDSIEKGNSFINGKITNTDDSALFVLYSDDPVSDRIVVAKAMFTCQNIGESKVVFSEGTVVANISALSINLAKTDLNLRAVSSNTTSNVQDIFSDEKLSKWCTYIIINILLAIVLLLIFFFVKKRKVRI